MKGTIHWVSASHGVAAEVRLYDRLFTVPTPLADKSVDFLELINPDAKSVLRGAIVEQEVAQGSPGDFYQFERTGYFIHDRDSEPGAPVLNRSVTLRDTWAKIERIQKSQQ